MQHTRRRDIGRLVTLGLVLAAAAVPCGAQEIFSDDFESGDTGAWSSVFPPPPPPPRQVVFEGFFNPG